MVLQSLAIVGDAQAIRDLFVEGAFTGRFLCGQLAPPLDGDELPSGG
jgi:hypothetical protein